MSTIGTFRSSFFLSSLLLAALPATTAPAATVRYDFAGTVASESVDGAAGAQFAADLGAGAFSGYIVFDTAAPDEDPGADELYSPTEFALTLGAYSFGSANAEPDFGAGLVNFAASEFALNVQSIRDFAPAVDGEFLSFNISLPIAGIASGVVQSPTAATGVVTVDLFADDGFLFGRGTVSSIETTVPPAIPEPDAWALMILGFGLAGAALRRRPSPPIPLHA